MVKRVLPLFCMLAVALLVTTAMFAQNPTGNMTGTVLDAQGAAVVGASVEVKDSATGAVVFSGTSGADGHFQVANLAPGAYTVTVSQSGFKKGVYNDVKITVGQTYEVVAKLEIGEVTSVVNVEAGGAQVIETQSTSVTSVVSGKAITDLPFNSRSAVLLGVLDPGAQTSGGSRNTTFEGLPKGSINITFDGINIQDNVLKSSDGFFAINDPRVDDVDEFNITAAGNSVDKAGEGAIQMAYVSKRGGNAWHGGVFETFRNTSLDSNYYFNKENNLPRQIVKLNDFGYKIGGPIFKDKLFFFTDMDIFQLPQSVSRSRTILTSAAASGTFTYTPSSMPTAAVQTADAAWLTCNAAAGTCAANLFALAANKCPVGVTCGNSVDPTVGTFLTAIQSSPGANGVTVSPTPPSLWQQTINFNSGGIGTRRYPDLRVDYNLTQHHSIEFDYHYSHFNSTPDQLNNVDQTYPVAPFNKNSGNQISNRNLWVAAWRWAIGSSASNELRAGAQLAPVTFGVGVSTNFYPTINTAFGPVTYRFNITGVSSPFISPGIIQGRNGALGEVLDNFSWTKGRHTISLGFTMTDLHYNQFITESASLGFGIDTTNDNINAMFSTSAAGNLPNMGTTDVGNARGLYASLTGRINSWSNAVAFDPKTRNFRVGAPTVLLNTQLELGAYAADSFRWRPSVTVNYGIRWQYDGAPVDEYNQYFVLDQGYNSLFGVSGAGNLFKPGTLSGSVPNYVNDAGKQWWNPYWKAFAPNVGFAWQPNFDNGLLKRVLGEAGKTVIRSSYSIAYDREGLNNFSSIAGGNPGYQGSQFANSGGSADPVNGLFPAGTVFVNGGSVPDVVQNPTAFSNSFPLTASSGNSVNAFNPDLRPGMVQSWTFGVQRELGTNQVLEVRYVGNHGTGLWRQYNLNEVNVFDNKFLNEFGAALNNLNICNQNLGTAAVPGSCTTAEINAGIVGAGKVGVADFANLGLPGQTTLPVFTGSFGNGLTPGTLAAAEAPPTAGQCAGANSSTASQCNANFTSSTFTSSASGFIPLGQVGSAANSLNSLTGWNRLVAAGFPSNFWMVNPDARGGTFAMDNATQSTYNGLIVDFRRRQAKGLYFDVNYAFSKSLTNLWANSSVDFANFTTLRNRGYDKGPAPFDIRHAVKAQLLYELPFGEGKRWAFHNSFANRLIGGWNINSITRWQTGAPILINSGLGNTFNNLDPGINLVGITASQLQSLLTTNKTQAAGTVYYVPSSLLAASGRANANVLQPCATAGGLCSKVFVWGPQFFRADISLVKNTKITERVSLELRAEALNAFNDTDFYWACGSGTNPCTINTQSTRFGQMGSTSTNGAYQDFNTTQDPGGRVLQLVGRINF